MVRGGPDVHLFCGEERFLKEEAERALISKSLPPGSGRIGCDVYNAKDDHRDIFEAINTLPLFSDKRVVVIRDIERLPEFKKAPFLERLKSAHSHTCLILDSGRHAESDRFVAALSRYARTTSFKKLKHREVREWVQRRLALHKKAITRGALELFLELKGRDDLAVLSKEIEKLATYKGADRTIDESDIERLVGRGLARRTFELVDAVASKDLDRALSLMREMASGKRSEAPEIIGMIGWQLRRIWKAKAYLASGQDKRYIASRLRIPGFTADKFFGQAGRFSDGDIEKGFGLLVEADRGVKSGGDAVSVLEGLIVKLCA